MTFQALLFCPDEKTARVTTQVLTELEFSVEACIEPFGAVKKLMGQHFDAIVVDCENEQNASLLFKSARNSSSNQASLAVAVVEGQAGVANAFRIGANLVLTKPINVEQAKSTLRVARGLLRKGSEAVKPATPSTAPSTVPVASAPPIPKQPERPATASTASRPTVPTPAFSPSIAPPVKNSPATPIAKTSAEVRSETGSSRSASTTPSPEEDLFEIGQQSAAGQEKESTQQYPWQPVSKPSGSMAASLQRAAAASEKTVTPPPADNLSATASSAILPAKQASPSFASSAMTTSGAASAPAPAREISKPQIPSTAFDAQQALTPTVAPTHAPQTAPEKRGRKPEAELLTVSMTSTSAPTFAAIDTLEQSAGEKRSKTGILLVIAAMILALLGYFGYTKFFNGKQAAAAPTSTSSGVSSTPAAMNESAGTPSATVIASPLPGTSSASQPSVKSTPPVQKEEVNTEEPDVIVSHPSEPKLVVKSALGAKPAPKPEATAEVAAPTIGMNEDQSTISNIVQSAPVAVPKVATPQQTLRVSQGVTQGLLTKRVQPVYPTQAMQMHIQGAVQVLATINKEGRISSVKILSGDPILSRAAADAVSQWRYKPYFLNGEAVEIQTQIVVNFKLP
jgi:periplasmic protein TonB